MKQSIVLCTMSYYAHYIIILHAYYAYFKHNVMHRDFKHSVMHRDFKHSAMPRDFKHSVMHRDFKHSK